MDLIARTHGGPAMGADIARVAAARVILWRTAGDEDDGGAGARFGELEFAGFGGPVGFHFGLEEVEDFIEFKRMQEQATRPWNDMGSEGEDE